MKILAIGLGALSAGLLASPATFGQSQTSEPPKFRIEIQATAEGGPSFTITNLFSKTLTAGQFRFSVSSQSKAGSEMAWDAIVQSGGRARHVPGSEPLDPEASMTLYLPRTVGGPLPDRVDVVAGIWEDGETFGETDRVKLLLNNRTAFATSCEQTIALLQEGLDQNWNRDQFVAAFSNNQRLSHFSSVSQTFQANKNLDSNPRLVKSLVQRLIAHFRQELDLLHQAKPQPSIPPNS